MSRKPTIKISYPDASDVAMKLTEAMVRRAPGRRVVETTSEDSASPAGGDLFADFDACSTSTSVDLTLTLNSASMDYALETLIRPNLTADEKKRILGEDAEQTELVLTPGEQKKIDAAADQLVNDLIIEPKKQIEIGKIPDRELRTILADLVDAAQGYVQGGQDAWEKHIENAIETAIKEMDHRAGVIDLDETYEHTPTADLEKIILEALQDHIPDADYITKTGLMSDLAKRINLHERMSKRQKTENQIETAEPGFSYMTYALFGLILATIELLKKTKRDSPVNSLLLYLDLAKQHLEKNKNEIEHYFLDALHVGWARAYISPQKEENARTLVDQITEKLYNQDRINPDSDPSWDDVEKEARSMGKKQDQDIEPGLLNDLDDGSDGMAPAEEVMGHDE